MCIPGFGMSNLVRGSERGERFPGSADAAAKSLQRKSVRTLQPITAAGVGPLPGHTTPPSQRKPMELPGFYERLRQRLEELRMTQTDLARELGIGVATVSEWFTRGRVPNGDVMLRLPRVLGVNGHWLLTGEGPREVEWTDGTDPYVRGARDALERVQRAMMDVARHFGPDEGGAAEPPPGSDPPPAPLRG